MGDRISPSILALAVGLAAGAAGAYGLATKGQVTIVGVMIAAALIPTAAAAGIGLAWGNLVVAIGALVLLLVSMIGVNVGGTVMLFYLDYRPDHVDESLFELDDARRALVVGVTALVVVGTVAAVGVAFYQQSSFERSVNDAVTDVLDQEEYRELGVVSVTIEYTAQSVSDRTLVSVTLSRTADQEFPGLPDELDRTITERTGRDVVVQVQYTDYEQSDESATSVRSLPPGEGSAPPGSLPASV